MVYRCKVDRGSPEEEKIDGILSNMVSGGYGAPQRRCRVQCSCIAISPGVGVEDPLSGADTSRCRLWMMLRLLGPGFGRMYMCIVCLQPITLYLPPLLDPPCPSDSLWPTSCTPGRACMGDIGPREAALLPSDLFLSNSSKCVGRTEDGEARRTTGGE